MPSVAAGHVCALVVGKTLHAHVEDAERILLVVGPLVRAVRGMKEDGLVFTFTLQCALFVRLVSKGPVTVHGRGQKTAVILKCCPDCCLPVLIFAL